MQIGDGTHVNDFLNSFHVLIRSYIALSAKIIPIPPVHLDRIQK